MLQGRDGEPFGEEAAQFMRLNTNQRDVEIEVEAIDSAGCAVGHMWTGKGGQRKSVSVELLTRGLASLFGPAASRSKYALSLILRCTDGITTNVLPLCSGTQTS